MASTLAGSSTAASECPKCNDRGFVYVEQYVENYMGTGPAEVPMGVECECAKRRRLLSLAAQSDLTEQYRALRLDNFSTDGRPVIVRNAYKAALDYVDRFEVCQHERSNSLALLGSPGCGKTHLVCAVANELLERGVPVLYFQHVEGFNRIKAGLTDGRGEQIIEKVKEAPLLVWDDLYKPPKRPTDWEIETVFGIVNHRYVRHLPLLISSELLCKDLYELDPATGSRLVEMAKGHTVELVGNPAELNYRLR